MQSLFRLLSYVSNYKTNVALNIICNILMAIFTVVSIPLLIPFLQIIFDESPRVTDKPVVESVASFIKYLEYQVSNSIAVDGKETTILYICGIIVLMFFFKNLFRYLSLYFMTPVRTGVIYDLRKQLFDKLLILPLSYFSEERKGDLMSRLTGDVQEIEWSILNVMETLFREPIIIFGCLFYMVYISPSLTLFVFVLLIFTGLIIGGIASQLKKNSSLAQGKLGSLLTVVEEALGGLRIIKGFNAESYQDTKFDQENKDYRNIVTRILRRRDLSSPLSEFLGIAVVAVLLYYGSNKVFSNEMDAATFFSFLFAFFNVINPAKAFSNAYYNVQKGIAATERVNDVLDAAIVIHEMPNAQPINSFEKHIVYKNVNFQYQSNDDAVLKNINLSVEKGKVIALVGASGAGKSTIADLLPRFYDVNSGRIEIDGVDIKNYKLKDLRNLMGIVSQEAILFNDTILNNIVFGLEDVTRAQVEEAARIAYAHDFIMESEKGYDTIIGDRGAKLSGGQRQRITIARAVLKNPAILILDEATSALDSESEKFLQKALNELMQNRTAIVIAHRLSTIQHADEIIVLDQGEIVERGTHQSLIDLDGPYSKLVKMQAF